MIQMQTNETTLTLPSDREILITRQFNAPRHVVFEAWTKPEHVVHWWGAFGMKMSVCEIDLRPGGAYHFVLRDADGNEYGFGGKYQEIVPPERLVYTDGFEGMPGHEAVVTATFEEQDGKTMLVSRSVYQSVEDRDGHVNSGMEPGLKQTYDQLEAYLATLQ
jgi:uncharacterized protein YndB with AHSA1/START domain